MHARYECDVCGKMIKQCRCPGPGGVKPTIYQTCGACMDKRADTPRDALIRGGHKHPDQILRDLKRGGFKVVEE